MTIMTQTPEEELNKLHSLMNLVLKDGKKRATHTCEGILTFQKYARDKIIVTKENYELFKDESKTTHVNKPEYLHDEKQKSVDDNSAEKEQVDKLKCLAELSEYIIPNHMGFVFNDPTGNIYKAIRTLASEIMKLRDK